MTDENLVRQLYPSAANGVVAAFAADSDRLFAQYGIDANANRLQYFLAQIGHESGGLTITEEKLNYSAERLCEVWPKRFPTLDAAAPYARNPQALANQVYANRMGNGAPQTGDGWTYRGRGFIQITGRDGYRAVGQETGLDLEGNPDLALAPANGLRVACGFWRWKNLNPVCDTGDFRRVTILINGSTNGLADRQAWLDKVRRALATPPAQDAHPHPQTVVDVQRALRARGYTEVGAADGLIGPRTLSAITRFRERNGLPPGQIDDDLLKALGVEV